MSGSIVMPQLGLTMTEGTVSEWLKKPGDFIKKNEPVLTISTDKVEMEVESMVEGTLGQIIVQVGTTVPVGTTLAYVSGAETRVASVVSDQPSVQQTIPKPASAGAKPFAEIAPPTSPKGRGSKSLSPRAKRLAQQLGIDTAELSGSGIGGVIVEEDIRHAATSGSKASRAPANIPTKPQANVRKRQVIAERLIRSIQTIPTFSVTAEANAESLLALYESLRLKTGDGGGAKLTITDLLLTVFADVLRRTPELRSIWIDNGPQENSAVDIGLAVATSEGVIAPVLRGADALGLAELTNRRHQLTEKARQGQLSLAELEGGVSTLSNLGMYRVDHFEALISPGQSSILAVGSIRKRPWALETLAIRPTIIFSLTVDHRIADGALGAKALGMLVDLIEEPSGLDWPNTLPNAEGKMRGQIA
jgi:pyruvate dehydrogenase E2 component (dihydrolipoamide acetyltransferase)